MASLIFRKHWTNSSSLYWSSAAARSVKKVVQHYSLGGERMERETFCYNQHLIKKFPDAKYKAFDTFCEKTFGCWYILVHRVDVHGMPWIGRLEGWKENIKIPRIWARMWDMLISISSFLGQFWFLRSCFLVPVRNTEIQA